MQSQDDDPRIREFYGVGRWLTDTPYDELDRRVLKLESSCKLMWFTLLIVSLIMVVATFLFCGCAGNSPPYSGSPGIHTAIADMPAPFYDEPFPVWTPPQSAFTTRTGNSEYTTFSNGGSAFTTYNGGSSYTTFSP